MAEMKQSEFFMKSHQTAELLRMEEAPTRGPTDYGTETAGPTTLRDQQRAEYEKVQ